MSRRRLEAARAAEKEHLDQVAREAEAEQERRQAQGLQRQNDLDLRRRANRALLEHVRSCLHADHDITGDDWSVSLELHEAKQFMIIGISIMENQRPRLSEDSLQNFPSLKTPILITTYGERSQEISDLLARSRKQWSEIYPNDGRFTGELKGALAVPGVPGLDEFLGRLSVHIDKESVLEASRAVRRRKARFERIRAWSEKYSVILLLFGILVLWELLE